MVAVTAACFDAATVTASYFGAATVVAAGFSAATVAEAAQFGTAALKDTMRTAAPSTLHR